MTPVEKIFAEEAFIVDVQCLLNQVMINNGVSREDLATAMDASTEEVDSIFADECEIEISFLFRAFQALGVSMKVSI